MSDTDDVSKMIIGIFFVLCIWALSQLRVLSWKQKSSNDLIQMQCICACFVFWFYITYQWRPQILTFPSIPCTDKVHYFLGGIFLVLFIWAFVIYIYCCFLIMIGQIEKAFLGFCLILPPFFLWYRLTTKWCPHCTNWSCPLYT